jgi:hypothetical protein
MKLLLIALLALMTSFTAQADELGLRVNSLLPNSDSSIVAFPPSINGVDGKQIHLFYDHDLTRNFYIEGAIGYMSPSDVFQYQSMSYELSPGVKVQDGPFVMKLSAGASYMPSNSFVPTSYTGTNAFNFVIHLTFGLKDPKTGIFVGLDRVHYSNGEDTNNPALNYSGFIISIPIGSIK